MRNTLLVSFCAHLLATLLFGVVSIALRRPLQPAEYISVNLASIPVAQPQKKPAEVVQEKPVPPEPKEVKKAEPEPEMDLSQEKPSEPTEQIVPPKPELPPPTKKEKPKEKAQEKFPEPAQPEKAKEEARQENQEPPAEESSATQTKAGPGVQVEKHEGVPDYYLALLQRKIDRRWEPSAARTRGGPAVACLIRFRISPAGVIQDPRIVQSSGFSVFDREALRAVISASPLPPPPAGSRALELPISVRFHLEQ
ncbi:MAG TPA: TonB family protein [Candidatus Krumholzibacteria bacterium]|nr:TonB family protein [Candidatus Krumholzibacteria bacterium]